MILALPKSACRAERNQPTNAVRKGYENPGARTDFYATQVEAYVAFDHFRCGGKERSGLVTLLVVLKEVICVLARFLLRFRIRGHISQGLQGPRSGQLISAVCLQRVVPCLLVPMDISLPQFISTSGLNHRSLFGVLPDSPRSFT